MKYTLFSIDNPTPENVARFYTAWNQRIESGQLAGNLVQCIGKWRGEPKEVSFCALSSDFDYMLANSCWYFRNQRAVLRVSENNNQEAVLEWLTRPCTQERLGVLRAVDQQTAMKADGWTYRPDLNQHWIIDVKADDEQRRAAYEAYKQLLNAQFTPVHEDKEVAAALADAFGFHETKQVKFTMHPIPGSTGFTIRENNND